MYVRQGGGLNYRDTVIMLAVHLHLSFFIIRLVCILIGVCLIIYFNP